MCFRWRRENLISVFLLFFFRCCLPLHHIFPLQSLPSLLPLFKTTMPWNQELRSQWLTENWKRFTVKVVKAILPPFCNGSWATENCVPACRKMWLKMMIRDVGKPSQSWNMYLVKMILAKASSVESIIQPMLTNKRKQPSNWIFYVSISKTLKSAFSFFIFNKKASSRY